MTTSLSTKLKTDIISLADNYLDKLPLNEGIEVVIEALKSIIEPQFNHIIPDSLKGRIKEIKDIIDEPELYVAKRENYRSFKMIVLGRVVFKINELNRLKPEEKERYINAQAELKKSFKNHKDMAEHAPKVGSAAHTLSDEEFYLEQQYRVWQRLNSRLSFKEYLLVVGYDIQEINSLLNRNSAFLRQLESGNSSPVQANLEPIYAHSLPSHVSQPNHGYTLFSGNFNTAGLTGTPQRTGNAPFLSTATAVQNFLQEGGVLTISTRAWQEFNLLRMEEAERNSQNGIGIETEVEVQQEVQVEVQQEVEVVRQPAPQNGSITRTPQRFDNAVLITPAALQPISSYAEQARRVNEMNLAMGTPFESLFIDLTGISLNVIQDEVELESQTTFFDDVD